MSDISFVEIQRFRSFWTGPVLYLPGLLLMGFFTWIMVVQLGLGHPLGERPMPDSVLVFFGALMLLLGAGLVSMGVMGKLVTEVGTDAVYVQLFPLTRRHRIEGHNILSATALTYRPILDYGGWGVRGMGKKRGFNIAGNRGVMVSIRDGRMWLIGSTRADELACAIKRMQAG